MLFHKASAPFIKSLGGFTLIELMVVMAVLAMIITAGACMSFNQYAQWITLARRETALDALIENRALGVATSTGTELYSFGSFSEPITVYENGELAY